MNKNKLFKILGLSFVTLVIVVIFMPAQKAEAISFRTPFGGQVEEYIEKSEAECVQKTCGKINKPVHDAVKKALEGPKQTLCAAISAPCNVFSPACYVLCVKKVDEAVEDSINICTVGELRVGPPMPTAAGILEIGVLNIHIKFEIGRWIFKITILDISFKLDLSDLLPGVKDIVPNPKIYEYKDYKTKGNWVIGDSTNLLKICGLKGEGSLPICDNIIAKVMLKALGEGQGDSGDEAYGGTIDSGGSEEEAQAARNEAETEYATSCPLLNLLHQVGSSRRL
jgi:hypothetical protein